MTHMRATVQTSSTTRQDMRFFTREGKGGPGSTVNT